MEILDLSAPLDTDTAWAPWWARTRVKRQGHRFGALSVFLLTRLTPRFLRRRLGWANDTLTLSSHGTTHLDAPWHYAPDAGGKRAMTIDEIPLSWCVAPGVCLDMSHKKDGEAITEADITAWEEAQGIPITAGTIVLIRTKGGDAVNVVPADVRMESFVRGRTIQGMQDASKKVDRAIQAGAMAVGASSTIHSMPGYLPLLTVPELDALFKENALPFCGPRVIEGAEFAGSFDMGDLSHLIPCLHPFTGGVTGNIHTREFSVSDPEAAYLFPAKALAGTLIDLLRDGAKKGKAIIDGFSPRLTKAQYLDFLETTLETRTVDEDPL